MEKIIDVYFNSVASYTAEKKKLNGQEYLVVPVVMMVEGVHSGNRGAMMHTIEELGKVNWNKIPVVMNHPQVNGEFVSAKIPSVLNEVGIGMVENPKVKGSSLVAEAWIVEERLAELSPETLEKINRGEEIEVSVGLFADSEDSYGIYKDEVYSGIIKNIIPDHLAILEGVIGACSIKDGCGIRVNQLFVNLKFSGTETTAWSAPALSDFGVDGQWQDLSQSERSRIAGHYLIGSAGAETFGELKLPVVNPKTGKLNERALRAVIGGRGAAVGGVSAEQKSAARRRAYRLLNSEFDAGLDIPETLSNGMSIGELREALFGDGYSLQIIDNAESLHDRMDAIYKTVSMMGNDIKEYYLVDVFDDNTIVYNVTNRQTGESNFYRDSYGVNSDGTINLKGEPQKVRRNVGYIEVNRGGDNVNTNFKNEKMADEKCAPCIEKRVTALIANKAARWTEDDREYLESLDEAVLDKMIPVELEVNTSISKEEAVEVLKETITKPGDFIKLLPVEMQEQMNYGQQLYADRKNEMVQGILANTQDVWTKEELDGMNFKSLEKLHKSVDKTNYEAFGGSGIRVNTGEEEVLPMIGLKTTKKD